jgi:hypothetical protein
LQFFAKFFAKMSMSAISKKIASIASTKAVSFETTNVNGVDMVKVVGPATFYVKDKLKAKGARWNPKNKEWFLNGVFDNDFMKQIEDEGQTHMLKVIEHEALKALLALKAERRKAAEQATAEQSAAGGLTSIVTPDSAAAEGAAVGALPAAVCVNDVLADVTGASPAMSPRPVPAVATKTVPAVAELPVCCFCFAVDPLKCPCAAFADALDEAKAVKSLN